MSLNNYVTTFADHFFHGESLAPATMLYAAMSGLRNHKLKSFLTRQSREGVSQVVNQRDVVAVEDACETESDGSQSDCIIQQTCDECGRQRELRACDVCSATAPLVMRSTIVGCQS